jgi:hypothetical protein
MEYRLFSGARKGRFGPEEMEAAAMSFELIDHITHEMRAG